MDQAARRPAPFEARGLPAYRMGASRVPVVRGLYGERGFRRRHARTDASRRGRANCVHVFRRAMVAMPSANHLGPSCDSPLEGRAHHANRETVAARAGAVRPRRGRTNHLRRYGRDEVAERTGTRLLRPGARQGLELSRTPEIVQKEGDPYSLLSHSSVSIRGMARPGLKEKHPPPPGVARMPVGMVRIL